MKLMILDGNSIINRTFYGIRPLTTHDGMHTNAIFGFLNILQRLTTEETPDAVCVAFDLSAPTFRHERYALYKANRHGMPEELAMQMPVMKEVLSAMGIPIYELSGWEADDVLGTVGKRCAAEKWDCVIVTGDRDSLQLIDEYVTIKLVISKAGQTTTTRYNEQLFRDDYGFAPKRLVDLKSLMGDSSDNIPGVAGVGQKTATDLMLKFGSLDAVYENISSDQIKDSVRKKLEAGAEQARLSFELATICCDAPITFHPVDNLLKKPDKPALLALFKRLEFVKLIDRYGLLQPDSAETATPAAAPTAALARLPQAGTACAMAVDAKLDNVAVATAQGSISVRADAHRAELAALLSASGEIYCADVKSLYHKLYDHQLPTGGLTLDVSLMAYLLSPTDSDYPVARLAEIYLNQTLPKDDLAAEAAAIFALAPVLRQKLEEQSMLELYHNVELPLCHVLAQMEHDGIAVDQMALLSFGQMLTERIAESQKKIFALADEEFNINSTQQLGVILFEKLGLPPTKKTKTGYSTNVDVLEKLRNMHPIIEAIMDYRMLTKLNSTYAEGLLKVIADDGRIHTTLQNMVTATGRLSSTEPNLQNIPVRTELGSEIRKMFVPRDGCVLVDADYSQIELRVLAHIAGDTIMQQAFTSGEDIHRVTASQVFGVRPEDVTDLMRRNAKAVNFGIVYGISEFSLSEDIGVSRKEAKAYIDGYLEKYSGVRSYMHKTVEQAKKDGFVTTLLGRRRWLPELRSSNFNVRSFGERCAMNTPIQGTAADIIKLAMIRVFDALKASYPKAKLILQVHDELIVECPVKDAKAVAALVEREMEQVMQLAVPLVAEAKLGASWYEAK